MFTPRTWPFSDTGTPGRAVVGRTELGLVAHQDPWNAPVDFATVRAFQNEHYEVGLRHKDTQVLNELQLSVAKRIDATAVPYPLEAALVPPPVA